MKVINNNNNVEEIENKEEVLHIIRHSASHILAQAIKRLYKDAKLAIGPAIDNGFYYDIDMEHRLSEEDLENLEAEMKKIIKENLKVEAFKLPREEAIKLMEEREEPYKVELIQDLEEGAEISFFKQGEFVDLCVGPHIMYTKALKAYKLMSVAGAYWRGDEKNKMLQRIYGTAFENKEELEAYITMQEEAKKRDHRKLGKELDLFMLTEEGPGFPFFLPKGMALRNTLESFWRREHVKAGYEEVRTPQILNEELWHRSGHWDHYKENMYFTKIDDGDYAIKPMNCPGGMLVYKRKIHSYKDLPIRCGELGIVHRHELSGALHGLMRVRCFTQDDAHIFMTKEQIKDEIIGVVNLIDKFYKLFGFEYHIELSTRPDDFMGDIEDWNLAEETLGQALKSIGQDYKINEKDGAFYGPKLDFKLKDSIGREWQCGTIQLDFQLPERFDLTYIGQDGQKHRPVMLHRVILGSIERFIGIITEHYAGAFPLWLAPVQVKVINVGKDQEQYAMDIKNKLVDADVRVELDLAEEKLGYKIRNAQLEKIPYMLVVGQKDMDANTVSVRSRDGKDLGQMSLDAFVAMVKEEEKTQMGLN